MKINPYFHQKKNNKKGKNFNLGANNNKKSCLVDLKPLDENRHREIIQPKQNEEEHKSGLHDKASKSLKVNIRIAKNFGFGTYFQNLREEILDKFLNYDEYISFDGLFKFQSLPDLFNFSKDQGNESINKFQYQQPNLQKEQQLSSEEFPKRNQSTYITRREVPSHDVYEEHFQEKLEEKNKENHSYNYFPKNRKKNRDYFENDEEFNFLKNSNKENDFEIENLKKNLEFYRNREEAFDHSIKSNTTLVNSRFNQSVNNFPQKVPFKNYPFKNNNYQQNTNFLSNSISDSNLPNFMRNQNQNLREFNDSCLLEENTHYNNQPRLKEVSKTNIMNMQKLRDFCSKRKMLN